MDDKLITTGSSFLTAAYEELTTNNCLAVEIEVENTEYITFPNYPGFNRDEDHSLRYYGSEFKSYTPQKMEELQSQINTLFDSLMAKDCFMSHRCSIHVHYNVLHRSFKELSNIIKFYYLFEPLFFKFVGRRRDKSNFCVPLRSSKVITLDLHNIISKVEHWKIKFPKYGALSLHRLPDLGSVEYRICPGTFDRNILFPWLETIEFMNINNDLINSLSLEELNKQIKNVLGLSYTPKELLDQQIIYKRIRQ